MPTEVCHLILVSLCVALLIIIFFLSLNSQTASTASIAPSSSEPCMSDSNPESKMTWSIDTQQILDTLNQQINSNVHSIPNNYQISKMLFNTSRLEFALVADLDLASRDPEKFLWRSTFKRGALINSISVQGTTSNNNKDKNYQNGIKDNQDKPEDNIMHTDDFYVEWGEELKLQTSSSRENRSMELSELVKFKHYLLSVCDYTGLVFRIAYGSDRKHRGVRQNKGNPEVFQR